MSAMPHSHREAHTHGHAPRVRELSKPITTSADRCPYIARICPIAAPATLATAASVALGSA